MLIDIHTHSLAPFPDQIRMRCLDPTAELDPVCEQLKQAKGEVYSLGIHPWKADSWTPLQVHQQQALWAHSAVKMIGEIGLDSRQGGPFLQQVSIFEAQLEMASSLRKPVVVHAVGTTEVLLSLKKKYPDVPAWILHGFRGKQEAAIQWLRHGFYLSFGRHYNEEALKKCPLNRLFLETDTAEMDLYAHYVSVAALLGCSPEALEDAVTSNYNRLILS
jgi:TatD DNase family protein